MSKVKCIPFFIFFILLPISNSYANIQTDLSLAENSQLVKAGTKFITLLGKQVSVGDSAPNFKVIDDAFAPVLLSDFKDKNILISVVPSLDTGVCSIQTKRFNEDVEALEQLNDNTIILTISNDLPFAQRRFCSAENIKNLKVLSDMVWHDFAYSYGVMIKDMGLLTRAIFIIDANQKIIYKELVENISDEPNYEAALAALSSIGMVELNQATDLSDTESEKK